MGLRMNLEDLRVIVEQERDPYKNLSIEEAILISVALGKASATLRLWINRRSLILGSGVGLGSVNLALCEKLGIPLVRRFSGGGLVYHDEGNLNWSFIAKHSSKDIIAAYEYVGGLIASSLRAFKICADFVRPNRIDVHGKKLSGMAGRLYQGTILIHGTLLVNSDLELLNRLCPLPPHSPPVVSLKEVLGHELAMEDVIKAIISSLEARGIRMKMGGLTPDEAELSRELYDKKYSSLAWNLGFDYPIIPGVKP
ncbi:MAG: lipoate--protein ligase family protein [Nitrososphaerota archaeon]